MAPSDTPQQSATVAVSDPAMLVPHAAPMVLLDHILSSDDEDGTVAAVDITRDTLFATDDGVPGWIGIEYMAQCIAAHAGRQARAQGGVPEIGYLVGTRTYACKIANFPLDARLIVRVQPVFIEGPMGSFSCSIETDEVVATAIVNTFLAGGEAV